MGVDCDVIVGCGTDGGVGVGGVAADGGGGGVATDGGGVIL